MLLGFAQRMLRILKRSQAIPAQASFPHPRERSLQLLVNSTLREDLGRFGRELDVLRKNVSELLEDYPPTMSARLLAFLLTAGSGRPEEEYRAQPQAPGQSMGRSCGQCPLIRHRLIATLSPMC